MPRILRVFRPVALIIVASIVLSAVAASAEQLERISYNNPGLVVDLGVGLWCWPLPMDYDRDGDLDLVVSCPDKPYNGVYFFENPGVQSGERRAESRELRVERGALRDPQPSTLSSQPVFKPAVRLGPAVPNIQISYVGDDVRLLAPGVEYRSFRDKVWNDKVDLGLPADIDPQYKRTRANQWKYVDFDGDGDLDVIVGLGVWDDYGWDDAWDENGNWMNGPLHGFVYFVERANDSSFRPPVKLLTTDGAPVDVYGMPSPNFADFDGDGDLDLLCGEFLDGFTYFQNVGKRTEPRYASGTRVNVHADLEMIVPVAIDWDGDGDQDILCGEEDGRVAFIEHTGEFKEGVPVFAEPFYFQQEAADVKFGALVTPFSVDWDGDGDEDLICGNTAGYIGLIENLGGGETPQWARPQLMMEVIDGRSGPYSSVIRYRAGLNGSIQGPCEEKWGYTTLTVADWDGDNALDLVVNGIWGNVTWHRQWENHQLSASKPIGFAAGLTSDRPAWNWWKPQRYELATQWRTTPCVFDWNGDDLQDLVMLDHKGYLALFQRIKQDDRLDLMPPQRIFKIEGPCEFDGKHQAVDYRRDGLLRLNALRAGKSGRRKLCFADWDGDGRVDLLVNSVNVNWLQNVRTDDEGFTWFQDMGPLDDRVLAGHDTSPTVVDWDKNGIPDLLVGAEDGHLYYKRNSRAELAQAKPRSASNASTSSPGVTSPGSNENPRGDDFSAITLIDLNDDDARQVIVDREPGQYLGHPTTVLLEDGRTMLCVYPEGHGKGAIRYQRSTDGGLTWSGPLPTPKNWATSLEVPTLHRVIDAGGKKRLIMWSGLYPARLAVSEDDGESWSELEPVGDWGGIVVMGSVVPLKMGAGHYLAMFHDDGRFLKEGGERANPVIFKLLKTYSHDGGLTWSEPETILTGSDVYLCEPGVIRSPDGKQLAALLRENNRVQNSQIIFSDDEGTTWSEPRPLPDTLNGDRHTGKHGPDGRLFVSFRCRSPKGMHSPYEGDWVGWVGTYEDLATGRPGQYYVRLKDNTKGSDCAYPGVEVLPDGTFVTTTYGHWEAGASPYILSVRFTLEELDRRAGQ